MERSQILRAALLLGFCYAAGLAAVPNPTFIGPIVTGGVLDAATNAAGPLS